MGTNPLQLVQAAPLAIPVSKVLTDVIAGWAVAQGLESLAEKVGGFFGPESAAQIPTTPAGTLINNIEFRPIIDVSQDNKDRLSLASDVIAENAADVAALQTKLYADQIDENQGLAIAMSSYNQEAAGAASKILNGTSDPKKAVPADAATKIKALERTRTDRYYVSAEYHEWVYCSNPRVNKLATLVPVIEEWAQAGDHAVDSGSPTFGEWVDAKQFRKAGEFYRRLVRSLTCEGGKSILAIAGTNKATLLADLIAIPANKLVFTDAAAATPWLTPD